MDLQAYKRQFSEDSAPGWDAIDEALRKVHGNQEPKHWGTLIPHILGGPDPLDGISAYNSEQGGKSHLHFCTYGFSQLYFDLESAGQEYSKCGFELTFRLATELDPEVEAPWVSNLLQNIARYVFESGNLLGQGHYLPANGPICYDRDTDLVGLLLSSDPTLPEIETPHGKVQFLQLFGITQTELDGLFGETITPPQLLAHHLKSNPLLITDLTQKDGPLP